MKKNLSVLLLAGGAAALLAGCGPKQSAEAPSATPAAPAETATTAAPAAAPDAATQKLLATLPAPYATGDIENGKRQFAKCRACHTLTEDGPDMTGPNLWGVFGRQAGSKPGYFYSEAVKKAGFAWDAEHMDKWLADPRGYLPGTKMSFIGLHDPKDRVDTIAYLRTQTSK